MKLVRYVDNQGRKRKGLVKKCKSCEKEFICRKNYINRAKYCSPTCRNEGNKVPRITITCPICEKKFERKESSLNSKSGIYFCSVTCKNNAARMTGMPEIWPDFYGQGEEVYRLYFNDDDLVCARCSYREFISCVEIHHIDENRRNNKRENLIPLCANCHRGLHMHLWKIDEINGEVAQSGRALG